MNNTISITTKLQDIINLPKKSTIISSSIAWKNSIGSIRALTKRKEEGSITLSIRMKLLSITRTPYSESQPLNRAWVDRLFRIFSEGRLNCPESQKSNQQTSASSISWRRCPQKLISLATECQLKFRITDVFIYFYDLYIIFYSHYTMKDIFAIILLFGLQVLISTQKLVYVQQVFRHGHRYPIYGSTVDGSDFIYPIKSSG